MLAVWEDAHCLGYEKVDDQHKEFFEFVTYVNEQKEVTKLELKQIIAVILTYMKDHFKDEEDYMRTLGYSQYAEHNALHQAMVQKFADLIQNVSSVNDCKEKIDFFLQESMLAHILRDDKAIGVWQSVEAEPVLQQKKVQYACQCPEKKHFITFEAHEKIASGQTQFRCKTCKHFIVFESFC